MVAAAATVNSKEKAWEEKEEEKEDVAAAVVEKVFIRNSGVIYGFLAPSRISSAPSNALT